MAAYPITITNPGAELGNLTGWVSVETGDAAYSGASTTPAAIHSGVYGFAFGSHPTENQGNEFRNNVAIDAARYATIDANGFVASIKGWQRNDATAGNFGRLYINFLNGSGALISSQTTSFINVGDVWVERSISVAVPSGTRSMQIGVVNGNDPGATKIHYWDDFSIVFDEIVSPSIDAQQLGAVAVGSFYTAGVDANQAGVVALGAGETSNTVHFLDVQQIGAYALVRGHPDRRDLRAWTFTQDDHDFYVLQLGKDETLVFDKLTQQWSTWKSPNYNYWRTEDGTDWAGINVACDGRTGKLWKIDPTFRLDYKTTPITSTVTGMITNRMRKHTPIFMGELAISEGAPPSGIDAGTVGISLRTLDQSGRDIIEHGSIAGTAIGNDITVRWYGLGLMKSPGHVFEITDTGYARRIDGFDIEVGNNGS